MLTLDQLKAGDWIVVDGGFDCMEAGLHQVHVDGNGLFVYCSGPIGDDGQPTQPGPCQHFLDGQENEDGSLIGLSLPDPNGG